MRKLLYLCFVFTVNASFAQTQADMNKEAYAAYEKADKELNEVYRDILLAYKSDTAFIYNLRASQRIWIAFRDAELNMKYPARDAGFYGSMHPLCRASYLAELTRERTATLRKWLQVAAEGDACSGSVSLKN
ncbi:lysozyme inhibitor LprI family protein [Pontibacter russatus]|uniref:lysozyme inhibitor LprI family protein n=1 Tax=Pontibacter russatus TaxID=2694929 RepID=UPI001F307CB3|nr:lysozyme inhibitor LprI family protein [Pontibacter russatus]